MSRWNKPEQSQYAIQRSARAQILTGGTSWSGELAAQQAGITTTPVAIEVTGFAGGKVQIYCSADVRYRFQPAATPTTIDTTNGGAPARTGNGTTGVANSAGRLPAGLWDRDVPSLGDGETQVFLVVAASSGTADITVTQS
jgi:hypothetical protein